MNNPDFLVVGGGIVGLSTARELKSRFPDASVCVLEKEGHLGEHASGRNSGVLHAGFYYTADSLKARFTREGNALWQEFCDEHGIPVRRCGKLVVARDHSELEGLDELLRRGTKNGVRLDSVTKAEAAEIEPRVKTFERALWSPDTATVDPKQVVEAVAKVCRELGVDVQTGVAFQGVKNGAVSTSNGVVEPGYLVNCGGLQADQIARQFGFSRRYSILPFKGLYVYSSEPVGAIRTNIYPVPNLNHPFLGVHFTITADGNAKIGPTAIPAFWREHYRGLKGFRVSELAQILGQEVRLLWRAGFDFRGLAMREMKKYWRPVMIGQAQELLEGVQPSQYKHWGKPGIRAQLLDIQERKLVMDFCTEGDSQSYHVLNAVSPAFTCAIPIARYVVDDIERLGGRKGAFRNASNQ